MQNYELTGHGSLYDSAFMAAQLNKLGPSMGLPNGANETLLYEEDQLLQFKQSTLQPKQILENRFQEDWYPEGIDPNRQAFLKSAVRNHSFDCERTFEPALAPTEMLIPKLFTQSNGF